MPYTVKCFACFLLLAYKPTFGATPSRPNVLFLVADDLRPELNCYYKGDHQPPTTTHPKLYTPNLDELAESSLLFKRAYTQFSLCAPSRASFLTGRRPDTTRTHWFHQYWRKRAGNFTTLPQYFKEHGYASLGYGKIFHDGASSGNDDPISWTEMYRPESDLKLYRRKLHSVWQAIPPAMLAEHPLPDQEITDVAVDGLRRYAPQALTGERPFFMAVGFIKPHLPFQYTEDFVSIYNDSDIPLPPNRYAPVNMPQQAWSGLGPITFYQNYKDLNVKAGYNVSLPDHLIRSLRGGYYRSTGFVDAMVGIILKELDAQGLAENTIVSFIGDHGFHLGEQAIWRKCTNFELGVRVPMIVRVPGVTDHGPDTGTLVELVDLFPTLVDLAGLPPIPQCPDNSRSVLVCTEGASLLPVFLNPKAEFKGAAFSQYPRKNGMGYTVRTDKYRYTEWMLAGQVQARELYDHRRDDMESWNRAADPEYGAIKRNLSDLLRQGWQPLVKEPHRAAAVARQAWTLPLTRDGKLSEQTQPTTTGHPLQPVQVAFSHVSPKAFFSPFNQFQPKSMGIFVVFLATFAIILFLLNKIKLLVSRICSKRYWNKARETCCPKAN